ncbi:MAG: hypothetical protein U5Q44_05520 [Dehalococcoidia bacterium]|nr:hypothetical protein [Dehalococcoidia bacterium]
MSIFQKLREKIEEIQEERAERKAAKDAYREAVLALTDPSVDIESELAELPDPEHFGDRDLQRLHDRAFREVAEGMLEDDVLTAEEERDLLRVGERLDVTDDRFQSAELADLRSRLVVAQVNDGRLPELDPSDVRLMLKKNETAHATIHATLMKERTIREYKSGHSGFSFRVMKGVYYHVGGSKGQAKNVGSEMVPDDQGVLTITSRRAVFTGTKRTRVFEYRNLLDMEVFDDGLRLAVSNRQTSSLFQLESGDVAAALINAAAQEYLE